MNEGACQRLINLAYKNPNGGVLEVLEQAGGETTQVQAGANECERKMLTGVGVR